MREGAWYGFDLGHGETAVSLSGYSGRIEARNLQLVRGGATVIPTVVGVGPAGETLVGEAALLNPKTTNVRAAFKHPDTSRADVREPVIAFVRGVMDEMAACGAKIDGSIVFGHPSGWSKDQVDAYRGLLREAAGQDPLMVPEARAAFLPLKNTGELSSDEIDTGRIVIVDMGSSTTDFAIVHGVADPVDLGNPGGVQLGAGLIELALFEQCFAALSPDERTRLDAFLNDRISERVQIIVEFRRAKETFFTNETTYRAHGGGPRVDLDLLELQLGLNWAPRVSAELMDRCLTEPLDRLGTTIDLYGRPVHITRSWRDEFFAHLDHALERIAEAPTTLVLTGGAAKMGWVFDQVKRRLPDTRVLRSAQPEHTIANGLALHGTALARSASIRAEIDAFVRSDAVEKIIIDKWDQGAKSLVEPLLDGFVDRFVVPAVLAWRRGDVATLDDIGARGGQLAKQWAESDDGRSALHAAAAAWYSEHVAPTVNKQVRDICANYPDIPSHAIELPVKLNVDVGASGSGGGVSPDIVLSGIDAALTGVIVIVSGVVAVTLFGAGHAALLATGPGFVVGAAIVGAATLIIGKEAAMDWVKGARIPVMARKALSEDFLKSQLGKKRDSIERDLRESLVGSLRDSEEARRTITDQVGDLIDSVLTQRVRDASAHLV